MAMRRIKAMRVMPNLAIRRNSKPAINTDQKATITQQIKEEIFPQPTNQEDTESNIQGLSSRMIVEEETKTSKSSVSHTPAFKYPNPVDYDFSQRHYEPIRPASPRKEIRSPIIHNGPPNFDPLSLRKDIKSPNLLNISTTIEYSPRKDIRSPSLHGSIVEPHSPKKHLSSPSFINIPRKRIRTESVTSTKSSVYSYDHGRMPESAKNRKISKTEESQRDSKRKRLNNIQNIDKTTLTMYDMIYYNPNKNPMKRTSQAANSGMGSKKSSMENIPAVVDKEPTPIPSPSPTPPPTPKLQVTPQIKLGPNGEMILDEQSLIIENEREKEMRDTLANAEIVYDDEFSGNSGYYKREKRTREWPPEETIRFYRCLHTVGTDFSMMLQLFPNRNRRDLKLKFKKEEKTNLVLVNKALLYPKQFNILELKQQFEAEDQEIERQKEEEKKKKEEIEQKANTHKKVKNKLISVVKARNPRKNITKSQRAMLSGPNYEDSFHEAQSDEADDVEEIPKEKIILPKNKENVAGNFDITNMEIDLVDETPVTDSFYPASEDVTSSSDNTESTNSLKQNEEIINITEHPKQTKITSDEESEVSDVEKPDSNEENVGFPFDIDINSLVLVESQDTENPDKPIFEIYVVDQETGKLGEKPLDLSWEDVEMIRSLMEENEEED